jgi:hypothetical protein
MKVTIELSDNQRKVLRPLVVERGLRGYSKGVQEAIDFYVTPPHPPLSPLRLCRNTKKTGFGERGRGGRVEKI